MVLTDAISMQPFNLECYCHFNIGRSKLNVILSLPTTSNIPCKTVKFDSTSTDRLRHPNFCPRSLIFSVNFLLSFGFSIQRATNPYK